VEWKNLLLKKGLLLFSDSLYITGVKAPVQEIKSKLFATHDLRLFIKREDLLHPTISGNKWRKLKYNLEKARLKKRTHLLTFGGAYSNHIAAVAAAGKEYGFETIGIIRGEQHLPLNPTLDFATKAGMHLEYVSREEYRDRTDSYYLDYLRKRYPNSYLIPEGGSNYEGVNGCMEILKEVDEDFDVVCCACGTGATLAGITLSLHDHQKAIGFSALKGGDFLTEEIARYIYKVINDQNLSAEYMEQVQVMTEYHFGGYAKTDTRLFEFMREFYRQHQIKLDPVYTGKAMFGIYDLVEKNYFPPGKKILMIHTGGLQGIAGIEQRLGISIFPE
jgi:1-aminocyclopropane-1-carboxylate deaminase